jgi:hypothetical protein
MLLFFQKLEKQKVMAGLLVSFEGIWDFGSYHFLVFGVMGIRRFAVVSMAQWMPFSALHFIHLFRLALTRSLSRTPSISLSFSLIFLL